MTPATTQQPTAAEIDYAIRDAANSLRNLGWTITGDGDLQFKEAVYKVLNQARARTPARPEKG